LAFALISRELLQRAACRLSASYSSINYCCA